MAEQPSVHGNAPQASSGSIKPNRAVFVMKHMLALDLGQAPEAHVSGP